ncbi:MAG: radical SAM protein [Lachnospiraceae bacterium]|nr:radical SAM protein [Lachnospiraceae bacterium]
MIKLKKVGELLNLFVKNRVLIYGAGDVASLVCSFAHSSNVEAGVVSFVVSNVQNNPKEIMGIEVKNFLDLKYDYDKILIAVDESIVDEIATYIKTYNDVTTIVYMSNELINHIRNLEQGTSDRIVLEQCRKIEQAITRLTPRPQLSFSVPLCEHCNLNCAWCSAFAPLAREQYLDIVQYEKDIKRLAELSGGDLYKCQLVGGEPLLNPRAIDYAVITRKAFPRGRISFVTNGLLLKNQTEEFFEKCHEYDIDIDMTPYPIGADYEKIGEFLADKGIKWKWQNGNAVKKMWKKVFDLNPNTPEQRSVHNWLNCFAANNCIHLRDGKMMCCVISSSKNFKDYFPEEARRMYVSERDYIDIYKVSSIDEIFSFLSKPYPFCKYCNVDGTVSGLDWKKSRKDITEWV